MRPRGFTVVEVIVALLILGLVITTTLAVFVERTRRIQQATETMLAWQALSNESEVRRRVDYGSLDTTSNVFLSDTKIIAPLKPYTTDVSVVDASQDVKNVTMTVRWRGGKRVAQLTIVRSNTGGSNLW